MNKQQIKRAIEDFEYHDNGFRNLSADIILKKKGGIRSERHNDCYYPLDEITERAEKLAKILDK